MLRKALIGLFAVVAIAGCDSTDPAGTASFSLALTDAPGDVSQAVVRIEQIELIGGPGGPRVLSSDPWMGDLTDLTNELVMLVEDEVIPKGSYAQMRLIISEACIGVETDSGTDDVFTSDGASNVACVGNAAGSLQMPSLSQTGIKVVFQGAIDVQSDQKIVLIDFDVEESFGKEAGGSGQWVMNPVIHGVDLTFSATVNVTVDVADGVDLLGNPIEDFSASLDGEVRELDANGEATFLYVVPGTQTLDLVEPGGFTATTSPATPAEITVAEQEEKEVLLTITGLAGP